MCAAPLHVMFFSPHSRKNVSPTCISTDSTPGSHYGGGGELCRSGLMSSVTSLRRMGMADFGGGNDVDRNALFSGRQPDAPVWFWEHYLRNNPPASVWSVARPSRGQKSAAGRGRWCHDAWRWMTINSTSFFESPPHESMQENASIFAVDQTIVMAWHKLQGPNSIDVWMIYWTIHRSIHRKIQQKGLFILYERALFTLKSPSQTLFNSKGPFELSIEKGRKVV